MLVMFSGPALALALLAITASAAPAGRPEMTWTQLPALPDREGFASMFAGVTGDVLLAAGGANFPGPKPWEGGTKAWYDTVFVLEKPGGPWRVAGKLPRPLGYGVSATHRSGVVCVGGSDAARHYADCFRLEWRDGQLKTFPLPPLPRPVANASGALLGDMLYVAGGIERPDATNALKTFYSLDLAAPMPAWRELEPWPGPARMLAGGGGAGRSVLPREWCGPAAGSCGQTRAHLLAGCLPVYARSGVEADRGFAAPGRRSAFPRTHGCGRRLPHPER